MAREQALHREPGAAVIFREIRFGDPTQVAKVFFEDLRKTGAPFELVVQAR